MKFNLSVHNSIYTYTFQVERIAADKHFEQFKLSAGDRVAILQSNRPMLLARGLKKKPVTWKVIEGDIKDQKALMKVCDAIELYLRPKPKEKPAKQGPSLGPPQFAKKRRDYFKK